MIIRFIFEVAKGECACGEPVLVGRCFACDEGALQIGILPDQEIKAAASCKDARLVSCTPIVGGDISLALEPVGDRLGEFSFRERRRPYRMVCHILIIFWRYSIRFGVCLIRRIFPLCPYTPRDAKTCRGILLLIGLFLLEGLNIEVPADSCGDLVSLYFAADDVRILAGGDDRILLCTDEDWE